MRMRLRGADEVIAKFEAMAQASGAKAGAGTRMLAESILTDVKASRPGQGVPKDEGTLANSGRADGPDPAGVSRVTFGGAAAPYALIQHEVLEYQHDLGEARYLVRGLERAAAGEEPEQALKEVADEVIRIGEAS